ncbi:hypothetical protein CsSME_00018436 [Camellia sinensis var. sinensis]
MNPKISDFGIARSFGGNETEASTNRVIGTYGYMSPEYAIDGLFSAKSDWEEKQRFLSSRAPPQPTWPYRKNSLFRKEESPEDRPSMSSVVLMLSSEATLPRAKQPGFFTARNVL